MTTLNPTVSILIPVYNGANYLSEAIDSALAQTYPDIEIIVVDDGSNDGGKTRAVALSYGTRIRYLKKDNGGVATALNLGIREMRGEFFSWLSHDDVYYPEKIARQLKYLETLRDETAVVFCNFHVIDHASRITGVGVIPEFALRNSILSILGTYVGGCSMLIPRTAFERVGFFNESLRNTQDNELWLRMAMQGYRLRYMQDILIQSRKHAQQVSLTTSQRHARETRAFYRWALTFIGPQNRVENAAGLFRILLMKRLPALAGHLFRLLSNDRSLWFALSSMNSGVFSIARPAVANRLLAAPGSAWLVRAFRRVRFKSSSRYWEKRYQLGETSGAGSYGRYAEYKAEVVNRFVVANGIQRVAEFGCGDGNQLKKFRFARYIGLDISRAAVDMCRTMYRHDQTKTFLVTTDAEAIATVRQFGPELTLSLDVIYHLVEDAVFEQHIANLFDLSLRFVLIYSTDFDRRYEFPHQVDRKFTDYIAKNVKGWRLLEVLTNPHKGADTQSDFYVYEKTREATEAV